MRAFAVIAYLLFSIASTAQSKVERIEMYGKVYTVTNNFPKEIIGHYWFEGKGKPIVQLNSDGTGLLHEFDDEETFDFFPVKIKFWIDCDESGKVRMQKGADSSIKYKLLTQSIVGAEYKDVPQNYYWREVLIVPSFKVVVFESQWLKPL